MVSIKPVRNGKKIPWLAALFEGLGGLF